MEHRFSLEKYSRGNRFTCPCCGQNREFVRYVDKLTGCYISETVGKCNRVSKCGYHYTPKQFFADNPIIGGVFFGNKKTKKLPPARRGFQQKNAARGICENKKNADFIDKEVLLQSFTNYEQNAFVQFLLSIFETNEVLEALKRYLIGTFYDGRTIFWQIDSLSRIRTGKLIAYDASTGKRRKRSTNWIHAKLKQDGKLPKDFELKQCLFGEHLLQTDPEKPIAIVEAEKTAVIASLFLPEFIWLAIGSKQSLKVERIYKFRERRIVLFPDSDSFVLWTTKAMKARSQGLFVKCSELIEQISTREEKENGFDLADYLIEEQKEINRYNGFVDFYNSKLTKVLTNDSHIICAETIIREREAILINDGGLPESIAIEKACNTESLRQVVLSFA